MNLRDPEFEEKACIFTDSTWAPRVGDRRIVLVGASKTLYEDNSLSNLPPVPRRKEQTYRGPGV